MWLCFVEKTCPRLVPAQYDTAARLRAGFADAEALKGETLKEMGEWERASRAYETALRYNSKAVIALNGRGLCLLRAGNVKEAAAAFAEALKGLPVHDTVNRSRVLANLGSTLLQLGAGREGRTALTEAAALAPDNDEIAIKLGQNLLHASVIPEGAAFIRVLARLFEHKDIDPRNLASAAALALRADDQVSRALGCLCDSGANGIEDGTLCLLTGNALLLAHLCNAPVTDTKLELGLTALWRHLALAAARAGCDAVSAHLVLVCALARQCFLNEYVWSISSEEKGAIKFLLASTPAAQKWTALAIAACYSPLVLPEEAELEPAQMPSAIAAVIGQQIDGPQEERAFAQAIPQPTEIADSTSVAVRGQYEENPYPRWMRSGPWAPRPFRLAIRARLPHVPDRRPPCIDSRLRHGARDHASAERLRGIVGAGGGPQPRKAWLRRP